MQKKIMCDKIAMKQNGCIAWLLNKEMKRQKKTWIDYYSNEYRNL